MYKNFKFLVSAKNKNAGYRGKFSFFAFNFSTTSCPEIPFSANCFALAVYDIIVLLG